MSRFDWSAIYWFGIWLGIGFGVPELTAVFWKRSPIETLSSATKDLEGLWIWAAFIICVSLWILNAHLTWRFLPKLWREITG